MRTLAIGLVTLFFPIFAIPQVSNPQKPSDSPPKIELKLIPEKTTIRLGEKLKIRVELWNLGTQDVIISQYFESNLSLSLTSGLGGQSSSSHGDKFPASSKPDFEKTFVTNWLTLNKNHFYGTYIYSDPANFSYLRKPGNYELHASYYAHGISSTPTWNGDYLLEEDLAKLPLPVLKGTFYSNTVTIQVLAPNPRKK